MNRGPLFRLLRLDRHLCPHCYRDNVYRRSTWLRSERCRWCGKSMIDWAKVTASIDLMASRMATTFSEAARMATQATVAFGQAMQGIVYTVDVETATHDDLRGGETVTSISRVQVLATSEDEARLIASQVATRPGRMPTRATVVDPAQLAAEEEERRLAEAVLRNPIASAMLLRRPTP